MKILEIPKYLIINGMECVRFLVTINILKIRHIAYKIYLSCRTLFILAAFINFLNENFKIR